MLSPRRRAFFSGFVVSGAAAGVPWIGDGHVFRGLKDARLLVFFVSANKQTLNLIEFLVELCYFQDLRELQ